MHDYVIVTKDEHYNNMAILRGFPPKVIWLLLGNCTTAQVETAFRTHHAALETFYADATVSTFLLR